MLNIKDYDLPELKEIFVGLGEKAYRAEQVFQWIYKEHAASFDDMTNLSLELRNKLKDNFSLHTFKILRKQVSKDGTKKYLFDVLDGNCIETVLMEYKYGKTICVSTQIGCKMGCKFCASTYVDFNRDLSSGEIVEQLLAVKRDEIVSVERLRSNSKLVTEGEGKENDVIRISNLVYMGIRRAIR